MRWAVIASIVLLLGCAAADRNRCVVTPNDLVECD